MLDRKIFIAPNRLVSQFHLFFNKNLNREQRKPVVSLLMLRANVTIVQTFRGNSSKFNLAHILMLGRPWCIMKRCIVRLAKYRLVFEKIDKNQSLWICHILSLEFRAKKNVSRNEITHSREIKSTKSCRMMPKYELKAIWAILFCLLWKYNFLSRTLFYQDENLPKINQ